MTWRGVGYVTKPWGSIENAMGRHWRALNKRVACTGLFLKGQCRGRERAQDEVGRRVRRLWH
jgi:hypothetical protein